VTYFMAQAPVSGLARRSRRAGLGRLGRAGRSSLRVVRDRNASASSQICPSHPHSIAIQIMLTLPTD
jgi:hypothetical protein